MRGCDEDDAVGDLNGAGQLKLNAVDTSTWFLSGMKLPECKIVKSLLVPVITGPLSLFW